MQVCEECGSTNLSVKIFVEQFYIQETDGLWTDGGSQWSDERAIWYCNDCESQWEAWFNEDVRES
jgi:hypothetical protein